MFIDMGQADRSLYERPLRQMQYRCSYTTAVAKAAKWMGFGHFLEVPESHDELLRAIARRIAGREE